MHLDVTELAEFYSRPLGSVVRRTIMRRIRDRWPNVKGEVVIGLGYAAPYLGIFRAEAGRIGALMPSTQGVITWPQAGPYLSLLIENECLPLADASVDRILAIHSLEMSEASPRLLREIWRVLKPEGRLIFVVPNRRSLWSRLDTTPFGHGRPYSRGQIKRLLSEALFRPTDWTSILHMPPLNLRLNLRASRAWERLGKRLWPGFGGLILIEAAKEVSAPIGGGHRVKILVETTTRPVNPFQSPLMDSDATRLDNP